MNFIYLVALAGVLTITGCNRPAETTTANSASGAGAATGTPDLAGRTPWAPDELLAPAELATRLAQPGPAPAIFDMGPAGTIKGARRIGPAEDAANLTQLRAALAGLPKQELVVVYCGCCPFEPCPNIRPAFRLLKEEGFTQARLLNLPENLKTDWIDRGYPMATN